MLIIKPVSFSSHGQISLLLLVILSASPTSSLVSSSSQWSDRYALLVFKSQIQNDPSGALNSWNNSLPHCHWQGITCNHSRVTGLKLPSLNLGGTLSPHIGSLAFLWRINLTGNNFHGNIPASLFTTSKIRTIDLHSNSFTGEIPTNLTSCSNLKYLDVSYNLLSGKIPAQFPFLSKLRILYLDNNNFMGNIPSSFGNLSSLIVLSLPSNHLKGSIPEQLCHIQSLIYFDVSDNNLKGTVPSCLYNLSNMQSFAVGANKLSGWLPSNIGLTLPKIKQLYLGDNKFNGLIPTSLTNATTLEVLELAKNNFTGPIPKYLGKLHSLYDLNLYSNHLGTKDRNNLEFIKSLTNCSNLETLEFPENSLSGQLPDSISNLSTKLTLFDAASNKIYGSIPAGIQNLVRLEVLDLEDNYLSGNIPSVIGKLNRLRFMFLLRNMLSGPIPASIGNMTQLLRLRLAFNNLTTIIPPSLGNCRNLEFLDLPHNKLVGPIPKQLTNLSLLTIGLDLNHNFLTGSLPSQVGNLTRLVNLDISENRLSGHLPESLGNCLALESLDIHNNLLEGKIPKSLKALSGLRYFDLSQNNLSGEIPEYLEQFNVLNLNLSHNQFEGRVPTKGVFGNASVFSVVGNNLCGGITKLNLPPCIQKVKKTSLSSKVIIVLISGCVSLLLFICFLITCYWRKMLKRKQSSTTLLDQRYERLTYSELLKATNGFANDNLIGIGSYGSVYKGILEHINQIVAVKVLNLEKTGALKSFLTECNALRNLRHRNLLKIITSCSSVDFRGNDFKALVLEFMPHGSLEEWLHPKAEQQFESRKFSFTQRMSIATEIASALEYLHHHCPVEVVHCDLKPSNVLLDDDMVAHVADFGIAKIFSLDANDSSQSLTKSVGIKGTIGYVAPEYGMGGNVSMQGDVYSYGILLLEMFTRKRPIDDMFVTGLNLHNYAKMAWPNQVMDIVDQLMMSEENVEELDSVRQRNAEAKMHECLVEIIGLGVACSTESPAERMTMSEVVTKLHHIMKNYERVRNNFE